MLADYVWGQGNKKVECDSSRKCSSLNVSQSYEPVAGRVSPLLFTRATNLVLWFIFV
jgi:hypothetical protein